MKNSSGLFAILGYLYILIPVLIFFIGWCNLPTAILGSFVVIIGLYFAIKNAPKLWLPENKKQLFFLISLFISAIIWVYSSGIGALVFQNDDHCYRNTIFELLVNKNWPVISNYRGSAYILTYYIAFWLPSAAIGKIFNSIQIGYYFQIFWAAAGIFLFFYYLTSFLKKKSYIPIIIFIFFSGMDIAGTVILNRLDLYFNMTSHLEWWNPYQFSGMTTQLFWVFNQAIAAWLFVLMMLMEKNNKSIIFLYTCLFLHATLPAIGIFPFVLYLCAKNGKKSIVLSELKQSFLSLFTFQNIIGGIVVFTVLYSYLNSNLGGKLIKISLLYDFNQVLIVFILDAMILLLAICKIYYKNPLYYITWFCLLVYPFIRIGGGYDFCMRGTIPALVILYLLICKAIQSRYFRKKCKIEYIVLIISLLIGAITPIHEFTRTIIKTHQGIIKARPKLFLSHFYGSTENNNFFKYFAKNKN